MKDEQILKQAIGKAVTGGMLDTKTEREVWVQAAGLIFSHEFAKAFWGEHWLPGHGEHEWKVRLKEMVLEEDPLKYLEKFL